MPIGRSFLAGLLLVASWTTWAGPDATAATPTSGVVGPSAPNVAWVGPPVVASVAERGCDLPPATCDTFDLVVDVPPEYWESHFGGVSIEIHWDDPTDHFQLRVEDEAGNEVAFDAEEPPRTSQSVTIPSAAGRYRVITEYWTVTDSDYEGSAEFVSAEGDAPFKGAGAFFDSSTELSFGPPTLVSAHFLGSEPNVTIERPIAGSPPEAVDPKRIFVDWPLSTRNQSSQLSRSEDGGETFRLLFDPACAQRSRPTCATGGGGDTFTVVNPWDGTLYFTDQEGTSAGGQGLPLHEAVASSTDHGDTFPPERQFTTTNTAFVVDRQWLEPIDPARVSIGTRAVHAFLSYKVPGAALFVQGIDQDGLPLPQPDPQLTRVNASGPLRVDHSGGPGDGWIYQPYEDALEEANYKVATARVENYQDPTAWRASDVTADRVGVFPWLDLDDRGNAYAVWTDGGAVYYSSSPIDDPRNNPTAGGRPGTHWSPQLRVSLPSVTSAYFGNVAAGSPGRIAVTYMGTKDHQGTPDVAPSTARWNTYAAVITNALGVDSPPVVKTSLVSPRTGHVGDIDGADTTLLDFIDIGVTAQGRVGVAFMDNNSTFAGAEDPAPGMVRPFAHYAEQASGPGLFETAPDPLVVPSGARGAPLGDAKWPSTADGEVLPSLDLLGASLSLVDGKLVARLPLGKGATDQMEQDLDSFNSALSTAPPAARLQYMVRFSTASDVYHLSAEFGAGESLRFFGGRLDANDQIANVQSETIVGAGYNTDELFHVSGRLENNTLVLEAPASEFAVAPGDHLFGVTAFSTAGPAEEGLTLTDMMRTVDATPSFDARLADPTALPSPSPSPTLLPSDLHLFAFPEQAQREVGELHEATAVVTNAEGEPVAGAAVEWHTEGEGSIESSDERTDADGRARAFLTSAEPGDQRVIVEAAGCGQVDPCFGAVAVTWNAPGCDLTGTPGADTLRGTSADEVICGLGGNDRIKGGRGSDVIRGGPGRDLLRGEAGADALLGGRGRDRMGGGGRRDRIAGGAGLDRAIGGPGNDRIHGGRGGDGLEGRRGNDFIDGGLGRDRVRGGRGRDDLRGGNGRDELFGGRGRDRCRPGSSRGSIRC